MLKLGTIVTVVLSLIPSHGFHLQQKDVLQLLEFLKVRDDLETRQQEVEANQSNDDSEENNSMAGLLNKMEVINLIEKADKYASKTKFGEIKLTTDDLLRDEYGDGDYDNNQRNDVIEELVRGKGLVDFQKRNRALKPNNLLGISQVDERDPDPMDPLSEYSKVYIVLDPGAIQKSQKNDVLSKLISKIYALSPSLTRTQLPRQNRERNQNNWFKVKSNLMARRYRQDSGEGYEKNDFRSQRSRHDDGGGGGGGGAGRTGIPYMRPRGDIYEKRDRD